DHVAREQVDRAAAGATERGMTRRRAAVTATASAGEAELRERHASRGTSGVAGTTSPAVTAEERAATTAAADAGRREWCCAADGAARVGVGPGGDVERALDHDRVGRREHERPRANRDDAAGRV